MTVTYQTVEVPVKGMDCAECAAHVQHAIAQLSGVQAVDVFLTAEKAVVRLDLTQVDLPAIRQAVQGAGYSVPDTEPGAPATASATLSQAALRLFGLVFGAVLFGWLQTGSFIKVCDGMGMMLSQQSCLKKVRP